MIEGGQPLYMLDRIRERYSLVMHGLALALGLVLLAVVLVLNLAIAAVRGWRERVDGGMVDAAGARRLEVAP